MEKTIDRVESKLDKLTNDITTIKISVARTEEHLKTINGTIERHEEESESMGKRVGLVEQKIWLAIGGVGVLAIIGYTKTIGLW